MSDVLTDMLNELRADIPEEDNWQDWLNAVAQVIAAYPTGERQTACMILVGNDIAKKLGVPWNECLKPIARAVNERMRGEVS